MSGIVRRSAAALAVVTVVALVQPTAVAAPSAATAASTVASAAEKAAASKQASKPKRKGPKVKTGVTFNNPLGGPRAHAINRKIMNTIDNAPKGTTVRVMSWNIFSRGAVNTLLRAQRRGVKIKVIMAEKNWTEIDNPYWGMLVRGVKANNKNRHKNRRSITKLCVKSCRGTGGEAHAKFFLFEKSGRTKHIYIQGSANLTTAAATNQWNDIVTSTSKSEYLFARDVFEQMLLDTPVNPPYITWTNPSGRTNAGFFPLRGSGAATDPAQDILRSVSCTGATNRKDGRTSIRVAPDVMRHERGHAIAVQLRNLYAAGCDVRIGYTVMGVDIFRLLRTPTRRGMVPMKHLVQDFDGDGEFDRYFHLKALSVIGNVGGNPDGYVVMNGSGNFSGSGAASDENVGVYFRKRYTKQYWNYINYWWHNYPHSAPASTAISRTTRSTASVPLFGAGALDLLSQPIHTPDTLMSDKDQLVEGVDPYAQMEE